MLAFLVIITFISALAKDENNRELGGLETREGFVVMTVWLLMALGLIILLATLWPVMSKLWTERPAAAWISISTTACACRSLP